MHWIVSLSFIALLTVVGCSSAQPSEPPQAAPVVPTTGEKPHIRGLNAETLKLESQRRGLICRDPTKEKTRMSWHCGLSGADGVEYRVEFLGESQTRIEYVTATVMQAGAPRDEPLIQFLGLIAASSYEGADPKKAHQWTDQNVTDNGELTIGGVTLRLAGSPKARTLSMFAVGSEWE